MYWQSIVIQCLSWPAVILATDDFAMDRPRLCLLALPPPPLLLPPVVQDIEVRPPPLPPRLDDILTTRPNAPYGGNDVFSRLRNHKMNCWYMTGETVGSFQQIVEDIDLFWTTKQNGTGLIYYRWRTVYSFFIIGSRNIRTLSR